MNRYRFALSTADLLLCRRCGGYVGAVASAPGGQFGIVNVNTLEPFPERLRAARPARYDGESAADRVQRRGARWTPALEVP